MKVKKITFYNTLEALESMRLKKLISYILLTIWLPILCLSLCGFTASGDVNVKHSGKGEATFFVNSALEEAEFRKEIEEVVKDLNAASISNDGSNDMVNLKALKKKMGFTRSTLLFVESTRWILAGLFICIKLKA